MKKLLLLLPLCFILCFGCIGCSLFTSPSTIYLPQADAPFLVVETHGEYLKVAFWSDELKELIEIGWIKTEVLKGKTVLDFNWEEFKRKKLNEWR